MARRVEFCWIVELNTPRGWEPSYESEINGMKQWADKNRRELQAKYPGSEYRVAKYVAERTKLKMVTRRTGEKP